MPLPPALYLPCCCRRCSTLAAGAHSRKLLVVTVCAPVAAALLAALVAAASPLQLFRAAPLFFPSLCLHLCTLRLPPTAQVAESSPPTVLPGNSDAACSPSPPTQAAQSPDSAAATVPKRARPAGHGSRRGGRHPCRGSRGRAACCSGRWPAAARGYRRRRAGRWRGCGGRTGLTYRCCSCCCGARHVAAQRGC